MAEYKSVRTDQVIVGTSSKDEIWIYHDRVLARGGDGNDRINEGVGSGGLWEAFPSGITVDGGNGKDFISLLGEKCSIYGGNGHDYIHIAGHLTTVAGGAGNDTISIDNENQSTSIMVIVEDLTSNDTLQLDKKIEQFFYQWDNGDLVLSDKTGSTKILLKNITSLSDIQNVPVVNGGYQVNTTLGNLLKSGTSPNENAYIGTGGDDTIYARNSNEIIYARDGDDHISISNSRIMADGENGNDCFYIDEAASYTTVVGGAGKDTVLNSGAYSSILGGAGDDSISNYIETAHSTIDGGAGADVILSWFGGQNSIYGGTGEDSIVTYGRNETLSGGGGNDTIATCAINATAYIFYGSGDGEDTIVGYDDTSTIRLEKGTIERSSLQGKDVILYIGDGSITLKDMKDKYIVVEDANGNVTRKIYGNSSSLPKGVTVKGKTVTLGTKFTEKTFDMMRYPSTQNAENLTATSAKSSQTLKGNARNNVIKAGSGNSKLYGRDGKDTLVGGKGKDYLEGGAGNDSLSGGAGNDSLRGGAGADILRGGAGNDTFFYANGDGKDTILDYAAGDVIRITKGSFKSGKVSGKDVILTVGSGSMTLKNAVGKKITMVDAKGKKTVKTYADPTKLPKNASYGDSKKTKVNLAAGFTGTFDSSKYGTTIKTVDATKNKKALTIKGNANANILKAGSGNTKLYGGDGKDTLVGGKGKDYLEGGKGNDSLFGGKGNDSLRGGAGNDVLLGGAGNDTFFYANDNSADIIRDYETGDVIRIESGTIKNAKVSGNDVLLFVGSGKITVKSGKGKKLSIVDANGKKSVTAFRSGTYTYSKGKFVALAKEKGKYISESDDYASIIGGNGDDTISSDGNHVTIDAGNGNDLINFYGNDATIYGGGGNDDITSWNGATIYGGGGDDEIVSWDGIVYGGDGADTIISYGDSSSILGGKGDDVFKSGVDVGATYLYSDGDGNDTIYDYTSAQSIKVLSGNIRDIYSTGKYSNGYADSVVLKIGTGSITLDWVSTQDHVDVMDASGKLTSYNVASLPVK